MGRATGLCPVFSNGASSIVLASAASGWAECNPQLSGHSICGTCNTCSCLGQVLGVLLASRLFFFLLLGLTAHDETEEQSGNFLHQLPAAPRIVCKPET
ncbi:hypothetical protein L195_g021197 [Trifolium pratense]|uniref:Uncharacterized protein n=1 Tax=Trifolium pratense TaxID=57577 RepID=A0A2K3N4J4_TRIPR|nr:hypothetical protein L195_g021197 [Trifolium pratense]